MNAQNIINKIKKIRPKDLLYPLISLTLLAVIAALLVNTAASLSKNINKAFGETSGTMPELLTLDRANYELAARKLGIIKTPLAAPSVPLTSAAATTTAQ